MTHAGKSPDQPRPRPDLEHPDQPRPRPNFESFNQPRRSPNRERPDQPRPRPNRQVLGDARRSLARIGVTRRAALAGGGAGLAAALLAACGDATPAQALRTTTTSPAASAVFAERRALHFTVIDAALRSAASAPVQNGVSDACQLLGSSYQWTGSSVGRVDDMVAEIYHAISEHVDGIAVALVDRTAFDQPVRAALRAQIPVLAYRADAPGNRRLAYIGQNLERAGERMGVRISQLLSPGASAALFVGMPGAGDVEPRVHGVTRALRRSGIELEVVASGSTASAAVTTIGTYAAAHPACSGLFGADADSTTAVGVTIQKHGAQRMQLVGGGFDLTPASTQLLASGSLEFVIDQQPYLQGFMAILELYLHNVSRGLTGIADMDTGARFLDRHTITPYNNTSSRYEGTSSSAGVSHH